MSKVSVIVPVYNVEPYLKRCLDSLLCQTLEDIEIIVVDDGSTDGSETICDEYAKSFYSIKVIHTANHGVACARNTGLDAADSDYVMFADPDDYVEPDFCRIPYECAIKNKADLVIFEANRIGFHEKTKRPIHSNGPLDEADALYLLHHGITGAPWNKLYHRSLFKVIRFPEGRKYEDLGTTYKLIHFATKIYYLNLHLYNYCYRPSSITGHRTGEAELDNFELSLDQISALRKWNYPQIANELKDNMYLYYLVCFGQTGKYARECSEYCRSLPLFPKHFPLSYRIMLALYRFAPSLFDIVSVLAHKRVDYPETPDHPC